MAAGALLLEQALVSAKGDGVQLGGFAIRQVVKLAALEAHEPAIAAEPEAAVIVGGDLGDDVVAEAPPGGEVEDAPALQPRQAAALRADPEGAVGIPPQGAHAGGEQAVARVPCAGD